MLKNKSLMTVVFCRGVAVVLCMSLAAGCTTFRPLPTGEPQAIREQINLGDTVKVTTRDGKQQDITVKETTSEQLIGERARVNLADITSIEKREFSFLKTGGLTVGFVVVAFTGLILAFAASGGGGR
ncbi:MAG: hypothetical protein ACOYL3_09225 [Desulfuromonadaceae bacterium]